jgi:ribosomal protein S25
MPVTFIYPTVKRITSHFSKSRPHPITGVVAFHSGTDFAQPGRQEIKAAAAGRVVKSYVSSSYGECIIIRHNIKGQTWETLYAHMLAGSRRVNVGDSVKQGQVIGLMGSTGDSTGQHLHFEIHKGTWNSQRSNAVDPVKYLDKDLYFNKSVSQMADEVIAGKHGNGHENRRKSLGISQSEYDKVRTEVNRRAGVTSTPKSISISQMVDEVIAGEHGNGHENRRKSLGISQAQYEKVRAEVNNRL